MENVIVKSVAVGITLTFWDQWPQILLYQDSNQSQNRGPVDKDIRLCISKL